MKFLFLLPLVALITFGCASNGIDPSIAPTEISESEYMELIKNHSKSSEKYDGFHNIYKMELTFLNTKVQTAILDRLRYYKQLRNEEGQKLREKAFQEMSSETQFFVSYYSPQKSLLHLNKGDALWKIYLEQDGRKHEASIDMYPGIKFEQKKLFPKFTRWSKGYILRFKVPTTVTENNDFKIIMTSSAGRAIFNFNPHSK